MNSFSQYTLLVVDDEETLRDAISYDFRKKGFKVLTASGGNEGFEIIKREKVDLVLSDVRMPNGTGPELLDKVKDKNVFLPVIMFITGFSDMPLDEAFDRGVDAIFSKPFDRKILFETVERALLPQKNRYFRENFRVEVDLPIGLKFQTREGAMIARLRNIGRGGMFVSFDGPFPRVGEAVHFRLEMPFEPSFILSGEGIIRWTRTQALKDNSMLGCGIEFTCLDSESIHKVLEYIICKKMRAFIPKS